MEEIESLIRIAREAWRGLGLSQIEKNCVVALIVGAILYVLVYFAERVCRTRTDHYSSKDFYYDVVYWFYYRGGFHYLLLVSVIFPPVDQPPPFLDLKLLAGLPIAAQVVVVLVVADVAAYWVHRAMHKFRFLWAFHAMHHAEEGVNFASSARFHPVEMICFYGWYYALTLILGADPHGIVLIMILNELQFAAQHTQISWKLGPLYKVFVTPSFHAYHHSTDPAHYGKHYSASVFSFWDYIFGTAVRDDDPAPARLGLDFVRMPTFASTLLTPFRLLFEFYGLTGRVDAFTGKSRASK